MKQRKIVIFVALLLISLPFTKLLTSINAASLTTVAVALSNEATSATGTVTITFTPVTAITNGSIIEVTYDTAFTGGGSLADADVTVTGTNITSTAESNFAAGYFRSTLTTSGSVTTQVTIAIDNTPGLTNPGTAGNYSFSISVNIGGSGSTFDTGAGLAYVANENDVQVTATVPPTIDLEIYQTGSDTLSTGNPNTCALGVLSLSTVNTCTYDLGYATNNSTGVTVQVIADAALNNGGNDINNVADSDVTAGSEEYGFSITDSGTGCGTVTSSYAHASNEFAVPTTVTTFLSNNAVCNGTSAGQSAKRSEVTHKASMDTSTVTGNYDQLVTYTAFTN